MILSENKNGVWIEIQPRFKIQYPMKNQCNNNEWSFRKQYPISGILFKPLYYPMFILFCFPVSIIIAEYKFICFGHCEAI